MPGTISPSLINGVAVRAPEDPGMGEAVETTDLEFAEHILGIAYGTSMQISARGQRRGIRLVHAPLSPSVRFAHSRFAMSLDLTGTQFGVLTIGHLRDGRLTYRSGGSERHLVPGDVLTVPPGHTYTATIADTDVETAIIDSALPSQVADAEPGRTQQPVRLTGYQPISPQAAQIWKDTYAYIRDTVLAKPGPARQPLLAGNAARLLVATALAVFPNNALTDPTIEDRHDAHPAALRRAVSFIDDNAHRDISIADIAGAAFVTIRALQLAFRRHLDCTPTVYLRRVRLEHAHRELIDADPGSHSIAETAYRWGFSNPSRFAAHYRAAYGVPPSHTLRQR